jgi:hypothetical protein
MLLMLKLILKTYKIISEDNKHKKLTIRILKLKDKLLKDKIMPIWVIINFYPKSLTKS